MEHSIVSFIVITLTSLCLREVRLRIILEVAEALTYLHSSTSFLVYHSLIEISNQAIYFWMKSIERKWQTSEHQSILELIKPILPP
ncbi:hypothetical protein Leryth_022273 [Lithospermum erythrorhizon]|uniref:Uncharacterized protein n=1 Tax=Lithospermum erythrorhizon TaxID=34254 RepID=A0AAV3Q7E3_LITER|nr:hypothetical protein Leryth_022273 [Lithospermum erythrorhizon]